MYGINCKKCGSTKNGVDSNYTYLDIFECLDCNHLGHLPIENCCRTPFLIVAIDRYDHDRYSLFHQCLTCGGAFKTRHLKSKEFGEQIRSDFNAFRFIEWKSQKSIESNLIYEGLKNSNHRNSNAYKYNTYLKSDNWREKENRF